MYISKDANRMQYAVSGPYRDTYHRKVKKLFLKYWFLSDQCLRVNGIVTDVTNDAAIMR